MAETAGMNSLHLKLTNIGIFQEFECDLSPGKVSIVEGGDSTGKTLICRALVAAFVPHSLPKSVHKVWKYYLNDLITLGMKEAEVSIQIGGRHRTVELRRGLHPRVSGDIHGEECIGLVDVAFVSNGWLTKRPDLIEILGMPSKTSMRRLATRLERLERDREDAVRSDSKLREAIPEYDALLLDLSKKWGHSAQYVSATIGELREPGVSLDEALARAASTKEELESLRGLTEEVRKRREFLKKGHKMLSILLESAQMSDSESIICPCCGEVFTIEAAGELIRKIASDISKADTEMSLSMDSSASVGRERTRMLGIIREKKTKADARKKLGRDRANMIDSLNLSVLPELLWRLHLPSPEKLADEASLTEMRLRWERYCVAGGKPSSPRFWVEVSRAGRPCGLDVRTSSDSLLVGFGGSDYRVSPQKLELSQRLAFSLCLVSVARRELMSYTPVVVADLAWDDGTPGTRAVLGELAREQGIVVVTTAKTDDRGGVSIKSAP